MVFISEAVRGELVGVAETPRGDWLVRFLHVELGRIDRQTRRFMPAWHGRRPTSRRDGPSCGNDAAVDITERCPPPLGNLA